MRRSISVRREHPAEPMIPDVSTANDDDSRGTSQYRSTMPFVFVDLPASRNSAGTPLGY